MKAVSIRTVRLLAALAVAASGARLAAAGPAEGTGEAAASAELKLDALVNQALERNARLAALRARWEAMREMPAQAEALANPMFMYGGMDMTDGGRFPDTGEKRFSVSQKLPWFGKRGRRGALAAREAEIMRREYEAMALDVVMTAKERYFDLYAVHQSLAIVEAEIAVLKGMESIAETKYATGEASQQDVLKAQSEATMLKARLLELQARDVTSKAELNALLNRPADAPLGRALAGPERTFEGAPESLLATALEHRPERKGADAQVERTALQDELMRREYYPDFTLGAEYRALDGADDMAMFMVGLDVPLWAGRNRAGVRQAAREQESGRAAREAVERQIHADVQDAAFRLGTARRTVELYRQELLPQAELRFKASEAGYQTGKADFMDLLESERFLLGARLMLAMAEGDLGMRMARLERALGTGLEGAGK